LTFEESIAGHEKVGPSQQQLGSCRLSNNEKVSFVVPEILNAKFVCSALKLQALASTVQALAFTSYNKQQSSIIVNICFYRFGFAVQA